MIQIAIDSYLSAGICKDIAWIIKQHQINKHRVVICRLPVNDFMDICSKIMDKYLIPFIPTLYGFPIEPWEKMDIGVFAVADDDTPLTTNQSGETREEIF